MPDQTQKAMIKHISLHRVLMLTVVISIVLLAGCRDGGNGSDSRIDIALRLAGDNSAELEKVLDHYRDDSENIPQISRNRICAQICMSDKRR